MAGEMGYIDPVTATEPDGTEWPVHAAIAKAVGGRVMPFDQYQGPYVVVGQDVRIGAGPYAYCQPNVGVIRLWITGDYGEMVYREDTDTLSEPVFTIQEAVQAALDLLA